MVAVNAEAADENVEAASVKDALVDVLAVDPLIRLVRLSGVFKLENEIVLEFEIVESESDIPESSTFLIACIFFPIQQLKILNYGMFALFYVLNFIFGFVAFSHFHT